MHIKNIYTFIVAQIIHGSVTDLTIINPKGILHVNKDMKEIE